MTAFATRAAALLGTVALSAVMVLGAVAPAGIAAPSARGDTVAVRATA